MSSFYCFYQKEGGEEAWKGALADQRDTVSSANAFVTVLDVDHPWSPEPNAEERAAIRFKAPRGFYADFDSDDIGEILTQARIFAMKLEKEYDLDLNLTRLYFSGGKGVHIEIPMPLMVGKSPPTGFLNLHNVFKEMAMELYVEGLDWRVYSIRRMWRTPNIKRSNGLHKVQVTVDEFRNATPEDYARICAAPRPQWEPQIAEQNVKLSYLFNSKRESSDKKLKARAKAPKTDALKNYTDWPASVRKLLNGEGLKRDAGWNQVTIQLAATALALNKDEDAFIADAANLINTHDGDGGRYDTPRKREKELRNQHRYQSGNHAYEFSLGGILSLFEDPMSAQDLRRGEATEDAYDDFDAEEPDEPENEETAVPDYRLANSVKWTKSGLYAMQDDEFRLKSHLGITNVVKMMRLIGKELVGFEANIYASGQFEGRTLIPASAFASKAAMGAFASRYGCSIQATDQAVNSLIDHLRARTRESGAIMYTINREGVDLIVPPGVTDEADYEVIYASPDTVLVNNAKHQYHFAGLHERDGVFKSDLFNAPDIHESKDEVETLLNNLLKINTEHNLGKMIGWFSACFICQPVRKIWKQFPLLQVYGEAGAGKSKTVELFNHMHYFMHDPKKLSASGQTLFPIIAAVSQSASFPVIFEEFKPREMSKHAKDMILNIIRNNYDGSRIERGGLSKDVSQREIVVNGYTNTAPIAFLGEAMETQTASIERCVNVSFNKAMRSGRSGHFEYCHTHRTTMGIVGKHLAKAALTLDFAQLKKNLLEYQKVFKKHLDIEVYEEQSRPVHNLCVVMLGLDLFDQSLQTVYGNKFVTKIERLRKAIYTSLGENIVQSVSEISKVLDVLSRLTRQSESAFRLDPRFDYHATSDKLYLKLRPAFAKYAMYCRSVGAEMLFDTDAAFIKALEAYDGLLDKTPSAPEIRRNLREPIFTLSVAKMEKEKVEPFGDS